MGRFKCNLHILLTFCKISSTDILPVFKSDKTGIKLIGILVVEFKVTIVQVLIYIIHTTNMMSEHISPLIQFSNYEEDKLSLMGNF